MSPLSLSACLSGSVCDSFSESLLVPESASMSLPYSSVDTYLGGLFGL